MIFYGTRIRDRGRDMGVTHCVSRDHADDRAERIRNTCAAGITAVEVVSRASRRHAWVVLLAWNRPSRGPGRDQWTRRP